MQGVKWSPDISGLRAPRRLSPVRPRPARPPGELAGVPYAEDARRVALPRALSLAPCAGKCSATLLVRRFLEVPRDFRDRRERSTQIVGHDKLSGNRRRNIECYNSVRTCRKQLTIQLVQVSRVVRGAAGLVATLTRSSARSVPAQLTSYVPGLNLGQPARETSLIFGYCPNTLGLLVSLPVHELFTIELFVSMFP